MKEIVIIGAGTAGVTAAAELRNLHTGEELRITIVTRELPPDYSRIQLPEFVAGNLTKDRLVIHNESWFANKQIEILAPFEVTRIHRDEKTLSLLPLASGEGTDAGDEKRELRYDALILALGSFPFTPGMPERGSPSFGSVFALRTVADAEKIIAHIAGHKKSAAVMGGGLLGLEAARALKTAGVAQVHVLENAGWLLPRQLDSGASALLKAYLESEGLTIHTGASVDTARFATHSVSDALEAVCGAGVETALYSMGVRSDKKLAEEAGLHCGRGITINGETATNDSFVFAAGDCAEFESVTWGIVPAALEQGKKAAQFAARKLFPAAAPPAPYVQTVPRTVLKIGAREAVSAGNAVLTAEQEASRRWSIHAPKLPDTPELYLRVVEDSESGLVSGALAFGGEGTGRAWLAKLQKAVGQPLPEEWR